MTASVQAANFSSMIRGASQQDVLMEEKQQLPPHVMLLGCRLEALVKLKEMPGLKR